MTTYFESFPLTVYNNQDITNILIRLDFLNKIKDNAVLYDDLQIEDGETAEDLADLIYGDSNLFWVILWSNNVINPFRDWLLSADQLMLFVQEKYGEENIYNPHHYETTSSSDLGAGIWVNFGTPFITTISNYDYEAGLNEAKRKIKIMRPNYISQILQEYRQELARVIV